MATVDQHTMDIVIQVRDEVARILEDEIAWEPNVSVKKAYMPPARLSELIEEHPILVVMPASREIANETRKRRRKTIIIDVAYVARAGISESAADTYPERLADMDEAFSNAARVAEIFSTSGGYGVLDTDPIANMINAATSPIWSVEMLAAGILVAVTNLTFLMITD